MKTKGFSAFPVRDRCSPFYQLNTTYDRNGTIDNFFATVTFSGPRMSTKAATTTRLLKKYYQFITPLKEYLANVLISDGVDKESSVHLETKDDSSLYSELLNSSYIAIKEEGAALTNGRFKCFPVMTDMKEVSVAIL